MSQEHHNSLPPVEPQADSVNCARLVSGVGLTREDELPSTCSFVSEGLSQAMLPSFGAGIVSGLIVGAITDPATGAYTFGSVAAGVAAVFGITGCYGARRENTVSVAVCAPVDAEAIPVAHTAPADVELAVGSQWRESVVDNRSSLSSTAYIV